MFYERLKSLALEKNKSFNQIERDLNLSRNTLANYKKGQTPSSERALLLANYFNVSTDYLLGKTDKIKKSTFDEDLEKSLESFHAFSGKTMSENDRYLPFLYNQFLFLVLLLFYIFLAPFNICL